MKMNLGNHCPQKEAKIQLRSIQGQINQIYSHHTEVNRAEAEG